MGTTALALLPYPEGGDPLAAGDDAIKALANALDVRVAPRAIAYGNAVIPITTAGTATSVSVTFPAGRFTAPPRVICSGTGNTPLTLQGPMSASTTATGTTFWAARASGTAGVNLDWLAIQ